MRSWRNDPNSVEILERALGLIDQPHKWVRGTFEALTPYGAGYCAVGAIARAGIHARPTEQREARWALMKVIGNRFGCIEEWNDSRRFHPEVVDAFHKAIYAERERIGLPRTCPVPEFVAAPPPPPAKFVVTGADAPAVQVVPTPSVKDPYAVPDFVPSLVPVAEKPEEKELVVA
jgi:hypothetical protein